MQLSLSPDERTETLRRTQSALIERFGRIERGSDQRRDPVWTLVQGVIGARTRSEVSNATTDALLERFGSWEAVAQLPVAQLEKLLGQQTFSGQSARRLEACLTALIEQRGSADLRHLSNLRPRTRWPSSRRCPGSGARSPPA